jgi:tetratricopeptide (TPR) repeat protein
MRVVRGSPYRDYITKSAKAICGGAQGTDADLPHMLHARSVLAARCQEQRQVALACLFRAVSLQPSRADWLTDLGDLLLDGGRWSDAEQAYRGALAVTSDDPDVHCRLARALYCQRKFSEASDVYERVLLLVTDSSQAIRELADVRLAQGRALEAIAGYERAATLDPTEIQVFERLGQAHLLCRSWQLALEAFDRSGGRNSASADLHCGRGEALLRLGRFEEAVAALAEALARDPCHLVASRLIIAAFERTGLSGAKEDLPGAWLHFGASLESAGRLREATVAYRHALALDPESLTAFFAVGAIELRKGRPGRAIPYFDSTIARESGHAPAHFNRGFASALLGDLDCGWNEFHWYSRHRPRRYFEQPCWDGTVDDRLTVLVWADQALGDAIQFARYIPLLRVRVARVILQCQSRLVPLLRRVSGVDICIGHDAPVPRFDAHVPLSYLPGIFQTVLDTVPNRPAYLSAEATLIEEWAHRLGTQGRPCVGLVWGGDPARTNAKERFATLATFAPFAELRCVRFVSLQHGLPATDLLLPPTGLAIESYREESRSIVDTAAVVLNLDLVITVDTMTAHLAGALGRPVWCLLARTPDWRWQMDGSASPWYPTMRLFRQAESGGWVEVVKQVHTALEDWTRERAAC